jgi:competence protein ComEC
LTGSKSIFLYQTASAILALAVFYCYLRHTRIAYFLLCPLFFLLGVLHAAPAVKSPTEPGHIYNRITRSKEPVVIAGILHECPQVEADRGRMLMKVESVRDATGLERRAKGLVLLTMQGKPPDWLLPGSRFMAKTKLSPGGSYGTPGAFDYQKYLAHQDIWLTGWIASPSLLIEIQQLPPPALFERIRYVPERIRYRLGQFLDQELPPKSAGLYKAILIGDRSAISPATIEQFKASGTMHLLAISGLHMGLLAAMLIGSLSWLARRSTRLILWLPVWKVAALLAMAPLIGYALIAGFQPPVARALIMTLVFLLALLVDRQWHVSTNIAIAALIMLIWQPVNLFTVSFQLSFAAVIAITLILPGLWPLISPGPAAPFAARCRNRIFAALAISVAASLGTLPLLLYYFNRFSPISSFTTLLVEPVLCLWALTAGLLACAILPLSPGLALLLLKTGALGITVADWLTAAFTALPFSSLWFPTPSGWELTGLFLLPAALFLFLRRNRLIAVPLAGMALLLILTPSFVHQIKQGLDQQSRVTIMDIGQGSAVVIELPDGRNVLIDGGGFRSERFDPGRNVIAPFLWRKRITRLDAVIISHPHADHYNGLPFIIERFKPEVIWLNGQAGSEADYQSLLDLAADAGIPAKIPEAGTELLAAEEYRLINVAGFHLHSGQPATNEESLVIRLDHGEISFLFPGDIGLVSEKKLLTEAGELKVDVLLAAHHGSRNSNSIDFLKATAPRYLPISVGSAGTWLARIEGQMEFWQQQGITPLPTAACGSIFFTSDGRELEVTTFRDCLPRELDDEAYPTLQ